MRKSMVWMLAGAAVVAVACVAGGAAAQEAASSRGTVVSEETLRDVEVMRRVLAKEGLGAATTWARNANDSSAPTALLYAVTARGAYGASSSEAFIVAGDGVTFLLRTSDPVAPSRNAPKEAEPAAEPTAWDEAEAEVDGRTKMPRFTLAADRYDAAKVEALRTRLVTQLAQFGRKVRGLAPSDHLTVVVSGARTGAVRWQYVNADPSGTVVDKDGKPIARTYTDVAAAADAATVLTIRVSVADCQAFGRGGIDLDAFRRRAVMSAY